MTKTIDTTVQSELKEFIIRKIKKIQESNIPFSPATAEIKENDSLRDLNINDSEVVELMWDLEDKYKLPNNKPMPGNPGEPINHLTVGQIINYAESSKKTKYSTT